MDKFLWRMESKIPFFPLDIEERCMLNGKLFFWVFFMLKKVTTMESQPLTKDHFLRNFYCIIASRPFG